MLNHICPDSESYSMVLFSNDFGPLEIHEFEMKYHDNYEIMFILNICKDLLQELDEANDKDYEKSKIVDKMVKFLDSKKLNEFMQEVDATESLNHIEKVSLNPLKKLVAELEDMF